MEWQREKQRLELELEAVKKADIAYIDELHKQIGEALTGLGLHGSDCRPPSLQQRKRLGACR